MLFSHFIKAPNRGSNLNTSYAGVHLSLLRPMSALFLIAILNAVPGHPTCYAQLTGSDRLSVNGYRYVKSTSSIVENWSPDTQLFVKGDVGIPATKLEGLAQWLRTNGPHWTVVLMESAEGEVYRDKRGTTYTGLDAVEVQLGNRLSNETDFGHLENSLTKETDGTVFVLFLKERKFSYFGSDAQDERDLGEAHWQGHLDQPAIRAMRSGGRIVDAVMNTVKSINQSLERAIQSERDSAERGRLERARSVEAAKATLQTLRESIEEVESNGETFRKGNPSAAGPLAKPPVQTWRQSLEQIASDLTPPSVREKSQDIAKIEAEVTQYLNAYAEAEGARARAEGFQNQLQRLSATHLRPVLPMVDKTKKLVSKLNEAARDGQLNMSETSHEIDDQIKKMEGLVKEEEARVARENTIKSWIRWTALMMLSAMALVVGAILWLFNRRRVPEMQRAKQEFASREASLRNEIDNIDKLFTRNTDILGSMESVRNRGYVGITRETSERALSFVDDLFIMSKEVRRVMEEARELIYPKSLFGKLVNLFSSSRYSRGINQVTGRPLRFTRASGLPRILADASRSTDASKQKAETTTPDEISMTFEDVYQSLKKRGDDAEEALDRIEKSYTQIHDALSAFDSKVNLAMQRDAAMVSQASKDGYFGLPHFLDDLIPSIQADIANADQLSAFDAVQAMHTSVPEADRKLKEANALFDHLERARSEIFPELEKNAQSLQQFGYTSDWIDAELDAISERSDDLMILAKDRSIQAEVAEVGTSLEQLRQRVLQLVDLAGRIRDEWSTQAGALGDRIVQTRRQLARQLGLTESTVLVESQRNPSDYHDLGKKSLDVAKAMLVQGRVEAAREAIDTHLTEFSNAQSILDASIQASQEFAERDRTLRSDAEQTTIRLRTASAELEELKNTYASSAFFLDESNQPEPIDPSLANHALADHTLADRGSRGNMSVDEVLQLAAVARNQVSQQLSRAKDSFSSGKLLDSASALDQTAATLKIADHHIHLATEHRQRLMAQQESNVELQDSNEVLAKTLLQSDQDRLVTERTLLQIQQLASQTVQAKSLLQRSQMKPNPFETAQTLATIQRQLQELHSQIIADHQAHAEASRAVAGAGRQLQAAMQLVSQSQSDGIADSQLTVQSNQRISQLGHELADVQRSIATPHGDWKNVDDRASRLQSDLSSVTQTLSKELGSAAQALQIFKQASQTVFQAENWSGAWGIRVSGSPGVRDLERARSSLQSGNYDIVYELSRLAASAAQAAIQQAEREVLRRKMEEQRAAEQARRAREAAMRPKFDSRTFGGGGSMGPISFPTSFGSGSKGSSSGSGSNNSGFGRSGW